MKGSPREFAKSQPSVRGGKRLHWTTVNTYIGEGKAAFERRFPNAKLTFKRVKHAVIEWK